METVDLHCPITILFHFTAGHNSTTMVFLPLREVQNTMVPVPSLVIKEEGTCSISTILSKNSMYSRPVALHIFLYYLGGLVHWRWTFLIGL